MLLIMSLIELASCIFCVEQVVRQMTAWLFEILVIQLDYIWILMRLANRFIFVISVDGIFTFAKNAVVVG